MCGFELLISSTQVVLIGDANEESLKQMHKTALSTAATNLIVSFISPDEELPYYHPAYGKTAIDDKTTAYVCEDTICGLPITNIARLMAAL